MSTHEPVAGLGDAQLIVTNADSLRHTIDTEFVDFAAGIGATHVYVGGAPFRYDAFLPNNDDPYPNWSQHALSLLRLCPPPAVAQFMPAEIVAANRALLDERVAALRVRGLKAALNCLEPMWLPEDVFRAHPTWRGAQCELGRIACKPYFTPNIDDPEVLELYRQAARELIERWPEIELLAFFTNDSGAGLQWSTFQYPGINGPTPTRQRGPGERVAGWLNAIRDGAAAAGGDLRINLFSFTFPPHETEAIRAKCGDKLYLKHVNGNGERLFTASAGPGNPYHGLLVDAVNAAGYVRDLQQVYSPAGGPRRSLTIGGTTAKLLLEAFLEDPGTGVVNRAQALLRAAAKVVGDARADGLVDVWNDVDRALHAAAQVRQRGGVSPLGGTIFGRWLVRPLVPQPECLTSDETKPFIDYIFSKAWDKDIGDLCMILGKPVFLGSCAVWMARWALDEAVGTLRGARARVLAMAANVEPERQPAVALFADRIGALACVFESARLAIMYQHEVATAAQPRHTANVWDFDDNVQYDQRALALRRLAREDLDNTAELIGLLEAHDEPVLGTAETAETESVFQFGPNLVDQLRHKMNVMLDHWQDYEDLYPTSRLHEYEPNIFVDVADPLDDIPF